MLPILTCNVCNHNVRRLETTLGVFEINAADGSFQHLF